MNKKLLILAAVLSIGLSGCSLDQFTGEDESSSANPSSSESKGKEEKEAPDTKNGQHSTTNDGEGKSAGSGKENNTSQNEGSSEKDNEKNQSQPTSKDEVITVNNPTSMEVVVNKKRKLPDGYTPPDLTVPNVPFYFKEYLPKKQMRKVAARALEDLFAGAKQSGIDLVAASGYRSYERQKSIYQSNVKAYGKEHADKFSARPGTSEHQTGLAMDLTSAQMSFKLEQSFRQTDEGEWLAKHAHEYGFIIRYQKGKSDITGYSYEPWHVRYVGKDLATQIYQQDDTLEEFFGFRPYKQ
ncbi:M15 family metallopeptidase [Halobacillus salinarum]|uniref:M15 family metallopeptidase n=1 Tax=Halobacillus salinarum TaxID=2932257 RepID=A0ABY4EGF9_9BACI|nr:M15 family metallopeptidase [Halobacillus salinarum]UOQ43537.1 M15 family metallopeptidase [Halobacillus salinarum]